MYYNLPILFIGPIRLILWSSGRPPPTFKYVPTTIMLTIEVGIVVRPSEQNLLSINLLSARHFFNYLFQHNLHELHVPNYFGSYCTCMSNSQNPLSKINRWGEDFARLQSLPETNYDTLFETRTTSKSSLSETCPCTIYKRLSLLHDSHQELILIGSLGSHVVIRTSMI